MLLSDLSWKEAEAVLSKTKTVLVPVGSFEAHGAHLPLSTDADTALEVARRAGEKAQIPVAPLLPIGQSEHLSAFPGTITFTSPTYRTVLREISASLFRSGADRILFINGHGGNNRIIQDTLSSLYSEHDGQKLLGMIHCLGLLGQIWPRVKKYSIGHSDFREASIMLVVKPQSVHLSRADQPEIVRYQLTERVAGRHGNQVEFSGGTPFVPRMVTEGAPSCGWGELRDASSEMGEEILDVLSSYIADFLTEFRKIPLGDSAKGDMR